jgi:protein-disulfide isomerase/uncharacterized membrane protein
MLHTIFDTNKCVKEKKSVLTITILSFLGLLNSLYTLWHRQKLQGEGLAQKSFCNVSDVINCDAAALSKYSQILGIPTSAWGIIFYSAMLMLAFVYLIADNEEKEDAKNQSRSWLQVIAVFGLMPTFTLASLSFFVLKNICIFCMISYLVNLSIAVIAIITLNNKARSYSLKFSSNFWIISVCIVGFALFLPTVFTKSSTETNLSDKDVNLYLQAHLSARQNSIVTEGLPFLGDPNAKVVLVEYSDFQCPHCARSAKTMPLLLKNYPNNIKLVYKNYPLDPTCNPSVKGAGHPFACYAAKTSLCVFFKKGNQAFLNFKSDTFDAQETLSRTTIDEIALAQGMNASELSECRESIATHQALLDQIQEAISMGVNSTPSLFLNGKEFRGGQLPPLFNAAMKIYLP